MGEIFIGTEALAEGRLTEHELRRWYQRIYPDVYAPKMAQPTLRDRTVAAWLWSRRQAVIAGVAASALHGASWVDDDIAIDLIARNGRRHAGLLVRNETLGDDETGWRVRLPVTTPVRTAFDIGRHLRRHQAVARLDALMRATAFSIEDVELLAKRYRGARGIRALRAVLPNVDGGAASPQETRLRLLVIDHGFPAPTTQIPVVDDHGVMLLDMGWEKYRVAVEYDGDHHRSDRKQYAKDQRRLRRLEALGWIVIRVIKEDITDDVIIRLAEALLRRGYRRD